MEKHLTYVINRRIYMTDGSCHRSPDSRAPQPGAQSASAIRRFARCGRSARPGLLHLPAPSLSLSRPSAAVEASRAGWRRQDVVHRETLPQSDRAAAELCGHDRADPERDRQPRFAGRFASRGRSWLTGRQSGNGRCGWNINLTGCWPRSWRRPMQRSCRTGAGRRCQAAPACRRTIRSC